AEDRRSDASPQFQPERVPERCRMYTAIPADARDSGIAWNTLLSFAGCLQDTAVFDAADAAEPGGLVNAIAKTLAPTLTLYLHAIEQGPGPVQLRRAYPGGLDIRAMEARAAAAHVAPPDP